MAFKEVTKVEAIPIGETRKFDIGELEIAITNLDGTLYAYEDRCPHMNAPLHYGKLEGNEIICPIHKAHFNIVTGEKTKEPRVPVPKAFKIGSMIAEVRTHNLIRHNVKTEHGKVLVEV